MKRKTIPDNLRAAKQVERSETVEAFENAMNDIRRDLRSGKLAKLHQKLLLSDVVSRTGLGRDVLKGDAHKDTTRVTVRNFVKEINLALAETRSTTPDAEIAALRQELKEVREQRQRALDTANDWSHRVRERNTRIRNLETLLVAEREKNGSKVVRIVRDT